MFRRGASLSGLGLVVAACSSTGAPSVATSPSPTASPSPAASIAASEPTSTIVGVWRGTHDCDGIADALADAGFDESVIIENIVGNGLLPGVASPEDVTDLTQACEDATPLEHSHEFTADGEFFSYDQDGEEVDFGTYELVDDDTLSIGAPDREDVSFDFAIEGDHLTLEPQLPEGCTDFECQWAVMVAMPWSGMDRVE